MLHCYFCFFEKRIKAFMQNTTQQFFHVMTTNTNFGTANKSSFVLNC